ncbi:MAG: phytoene/squalene synthase family protein [Spirochaetaceae bacterium]|nr:MAG: phytoene/squalene synthase family protein [Spirochaetaceae bacterium]
MNNGVYEQHSHTFKAGSKTYFYTSLFFPKSARKDVFCLYSFVRIADNFVDAQPQQAKDFLEFCQKYRAALNGTPARDNVIDPFVELSQRKQFEPEWTEAFLRSMEWDLSRSVYATEQEMLEYIYGSAEVIGLFMARILGLPIESYQAAMVQGRAMQLINFIRDIQEDIELGRQYLPAGETGLADLRYETAKQEPEEFIRFVRSQIDRYNGWQAQAEAGFSFLPFRSRIPVAAAADMYNWTARKIYKDPFIVYKKKVKPSRFRVVTQVALRSLGLTGSK